VTRSSTHAKSKTGSSVAYFFFRRLVVFFAVFFTAALAFLFFAIAALLAMSGWRYRCSAVANRSALPPDYYSEKKITVTHLNFVRNRRLRLAHRARNTIADAARAKILFIAARTREKIRRFAEVPMLHGFLSHQILRQRGERKRSA
jgi:hypothetical protein